MVNLLRLTLATVYLTYLMMSATLLDRPRELVLRYTFFRNLLDCYKCTGLWAGLIAYLLPLPVLTVLALAGANLIIGGIGGDETTES